MNIIGYGQASKEEVAVFEELLGFSLPKDYKQFLYQFNGGKPVVRTTGFRVPDLNNEIMPLHLLYGLFDSSNNCLDLRNWYEFNKEDLIPHSLIIGRDYFSGDVILINEAVYYWDVSNSFEQSSSEFNTYKIADSFSEFLGGLKYVED